MHGGLRILTARPASTYPSRGVVTEPDQAMYGMMRANLVKTLARIADYRNTLAHRGRTALSEGEKAQRERAYNAFDEMWLDRFGRLPHKDSDGSEGVTEPAGVPKRGRRSKVDMVLDDVRTEEKPGTRKRARVEKGISMTIDKEKDWWDAPYYG